MTLGIRPEVLRHANRVGRASSHALVVTAVVLTSLLAAGTAQAQSLPSGWSAAHVGKPAIRGSVAYDGSRFTVTGGGTDIWGTADEFMFVFRRISGDTTIVARVDALDAADEWSKAGVMVRESLDPGSKHLFALVSGGKGVALQGRKSTNSSSAHKDAGPGRAPVWLKIQRSGSSFTASRSADGSSWTAITSVSISMASNVYVGLALSSHVPTQAARARFSSVTVGAPAPAGWASVDVGGPIARGSSSSSGSSFTVFGAGADIWNTADQFHFVNRKVTGDLDIIARVTAIQAAHDWTKAGIMIRSSLHPSSAHASMFISAGKGFAFQRRPVNNALSLHTSGGSGTVPGWIKLERRGSSITSFRSSDGVSWRMIGSETVDLPSSFYVGLAVTSHYTGTLAGAKFDNVKIVQASTGGSTPPPSQPAPEPEPEPEPEPTKPPPDASPTPSVKNAVFQPSTDHSAVSFYRLEIFVAGSDPARTAPVASQNLGKPAVVNGECKVDVSSTLAALKSGSYFATVAAVNNAGASRSTPSPTFSR